MSTRPPNQRIPVAVLTGFLGSGKTTILRHLMESHALSRTLVIINEFGEVGLDHQLVSHVDDDTVVALSSGCICCTIRGDLAETLARAPGRYARGGKRWFDRVIIETTGIADPAPILQTLLAEPAVLRHYAMARVLTTVDAVNGESALAAYPEAVKQIGVADQLLITKTDLVTPAHLAALRRGLEELAPMAQVKLIEHGVRLWRFFSAVAPGYWKRTPPMLPPGLRRNPSTTNRTPRREWNHIIIATNTRLGIHITATTCTTSIGTVRFRQATLFSKTPLTPVPWIAVWKPCLLSTVRSSCA